MSQTRTLYRLLKAAGPQGIHSLTLRTEYRMGDPARRICDLEAQGFRIQHIPQRKGKTNGTRYILLGGPVEVARSQSASDPGGHQSEWSSSDSPPRSGDGGGAVIEDEGSAAPIRYPARSMKQWSMAPDGREGWHRVRDLDGSWWWELRPEKPAQTELVAA